MAPISYARHRFPPAIIQHAIWLYLCFTLSYRDAADLLAARGRAAAPRPPPVPARHHPARDMALPVLHAQLPRRRGPAGRAWSRHFLRNGPALGAEVRSGPRQAASAAHD